MKFPSIPSWIEFWRIGETDHTSLKLLFQPDTSRLFPFRNFFPSHWNRSFCHSISTSRNKSAAISPFSRIPTLKSYRSNLARLTTSSLLFFSKFLSCGLPFFFYIVIIHHRGYENANVWRWKLFFAELAKSRRLQRGCKGFRFFFLPPFLIQTHYN